LTKVIYVRHGQTSWNKAKKYQGHSDISLNEIGLEQAQLVGKRLAKENISAVYSSDLSRASQTANIIARHHNLQGIKIKGFREINFGLWEGCTYAEIMALWPNALTSMYSSPGAMNAPEGENFIDLKRRAKSALNQCIKEHEEETIVIVSHGGTMRVLLCDALQLSLDKMWSIRQDSTGINIIEYFSNQPILSLVNDTCHLK